MVYVDICETRARWCGWLLKIISLPPQVSRLFIIRKHVFSSYGHGFSVGGVNKGTGKYEPQPMITHIRDLNVMITRSRNKT